jgi:hypothetical protein
MYLNERNYQSSLQCQSRLSSTFREKRDYSCNSHGNFLDKTMHFHRILYVSEELGGRMQSMPTCTNVDLG